MLKDRVKIRDVKITLKIYLKSTKLMRNNRKNLIKQLNKYNSNIKKKLNKDFQVLNSSTTNFNKGHSFFKNILRKK